MAILVSDAAEKYATSGAGAELLDIDINPFVVNGKRLNSPIILYINVFSGAVSFRVVPRNSPAPTFNNPALIPGSAGLSPNPGIVGPLIVNLFVNDLYVYSEEASEFSINTIQEVR